MCHVQKSHLFGNIADPQGRVLQKLLRLFHADMVQSFRKILPRIFIQQFAQMPLAHINIIRHISQLQPFRIVRLDKSERVLYNKTAGRAFQLFLFLLLIILVLLV